MDELIYSNPISQGAFTTLSGGKPKLDSSGYKNYHFKPSVAGIHQKPVLCRLLFYMCIHMRGRGRLSRKSRMRYCYRHKRRHFCIIDISHTGFSFKQTELYMQVLIIRKIHAYVLNLICQNVFRLQTWK